jgi:citrate synthase
MARSVGLISHVVERVEDALENAFGSTDLESSEPSADDIARVDAIRKETVL